MVQGDFFCFLQPHLNLAAVLEMKHQSLICVYGYVVNGGVPEGLVELKLKGVKLGDGEKKSAHNILLNFRCTIYHSKEG